MIKASKVVFISEELEKDFYALKNDDPIKKSMIRAITSSFHCNAFYPKWLMIVDCHNFYKPHKFSNTNMTQGTNKALIMSFVLIAGLVIFNFLDYTGMVVNEKEEWACSQYVCDKAITAQEWVNKNCYTLPDGSNQVVCKVIIENKEQLVPLSTINTQTLNQCIEARCVQEARVRPVNYTVEMQKPQE